MPSRPSKHRVHSRAPYAHSTLINWNAANAARGSVCIDRLAVGTLSVEGYEVRVQLTRHERGALAFRRLREAAQVKSTTAGCVCAGISHGRMPACHAINGYAQAREQVAMRQIGVGRPVECVGHDPAYRAAISPIDPSGGETGRGSVKASLHPRRISLSASSQVVPGSRRSQLSRKHEAHSFQVSPANTARPTRPKCSANSEGEPCIPMITGTIAMVDCGRN